MSHEKRLQEFHNLWKQGITFEMLDPDAGTRYNSIGADSYFYVDYSLGIVPPCDRPDVSFPIDSSIIDEYFEFIADEHGERKRTIVQLEREIRETVEIRGGEVFLFQREIHEDKEGNIVYEGPCSTMIGCRFPKEAIRNQVTREIWDALGMYGVTIDEETREVIMNLDERIALYAWFKARIESNPEREDQLRLMKGPAFDELKDRIINAQIAEWETTREGHDS